MEVIESFIRGKYHDQSLCEDGIFVGAGMVAVIDGATSHGKLLWNGGRSGRFAKEVIGGFLRDHEEELVGLSAVEGLRRVGDFLAERIEETHPGPKALEEYPRASIVLYNSVAGEVWSYGDCQCRIGGELHSEVKEVDRLLSELRQFIVMSAMREQAEGTDRTESDFSEQIARHDIGREAVVPLIRRQLWFENEEGPFGYPVLNGRNFAEGMVKVWPVPAGAEVVLASDGYPELCGTLAESEEKLAEILAEDPLCIGRNPGVKGIMEGMESFDDRAFVKVRG